MGKVRQTAKVPNGIMHDALAYRGLDFDYREHRFWSKDNDIMEPVHGRVPMQVVQDDVHLGGQDVIVRKYETLCDADGARKVLPKKLAQCGLRERADSRVVVGDKYANLIETRHELLCGKMEVLVHI
jgi:hypothetical protein